MKKSKLIGLFVFLFLTISCSKTDFLKWDLIGVPEVIDLKITNNTINDFIVQANFKSNGFDDNAKHGFVFINSTIEPTLSTNDTVIYLTGNKLGTKNAELNWYTSNPIQVRAFITNKIGTFYSNVLIIDWQGSQVNLPQVNTTPLSDINFYSVNCGSQLINDGGLQISKLGVLISTNSNPTELNSNFIEYTTDTPIFNKLIDGLTENTTYYVRGFAENIAGKGLANNIVSFTTKNFFQIGETGPAGGIIFYNKTDTIGGWNFMEAYPNDQTIELPWSSNINLDLFLGVGIGTGKLNTNTIINAFGLNSTNYAAKYCYSLNFGGYTDWFLPSRDELIKVYQNLFLNNLGSLSSNTKYWSSSDDNYFTQNSWCQIMSNNTGSVNSISILKNANLKVRPIRCF